MLRSKTLPTVVVEGSASSRAERTEAGEGAGEKLKQLMPLSSLSESVIVVVVSFGSCERTLCTHARDPSVANGCGAAKRSSYVPMCGRLFPLNDSTFSPPHMPHTARACEKTSRGR
eukprot:1991246-Rhodomonas_salina.1